MRGQSCVELQKRTPGAPLSEAERQQRAEAARARWEKAQRVVYRGAPGPDPSPRPRQYGAIYTSPHRAVASMYGRVDANTGEKLATPGSLSRYELDPEAKIARIGTPVWRLIVARNNLTPRRKDEGHDQIWAIKPSGLRAARRLGIDAIESRDPAVSIRPSAARKIPEELIVLSPEKLRFTGSTLIKRTPGAPLSDAELEQRREAAKARWAQHAAAAAGGAALSAGAAEIVRRSLKGEALRAAWDARHQHTQPIRDARASHAARIKAIDKLAARGRSEIGRPNEKAVGYRRWPVPAYRRMLERQKGRLEQVDLKAATDFHDARAVIYQIEDIEAGLDSLKDARPPSIGPRRGYTATREAEFWSARRKLSPQDLLGRMNPLDRESYEIALAEAKAHRLNQLPDPADFVSNWDEIVMINRAGEPVLKPKKKRVPVAGNVGAAWRVAPAMVRRQGSPKDARLRGMRQELLEALQRRTTKLKTANAERTDRIVTRLHAARREAVRQAIARAPKLRSGHVAGLGLLGAAIGAGASYALSKADTPRDMPDRRGGGGGDLAANLARVFRGWLENPEALDPDDLAEATKPVAYAFGEGAEAQNRLFTEAAEGRRKILAGSFGARNPRVEAAAREHQIKLVGEIADTQMAAIRQALVDHALRGDTMETTARAIRESIGLTPAQARHVAAYRLELETGHPGALRRALRDRRFDRTVEKALADKKPIPPEKIDQMVDAYQRRYIAYRAMTIARTETLRAANAGAVASAQAQLEAMPDMTVIKRWVATHDDRTRPDHRELDGKAVLGMDTPFILADGSTIRWPHDPEAPAAQVCNCRCSISFSLVPRATAVQQFMAEAA